MQHTPFKIEKIEEPNEEDSNMIMLTSKPIKMNRTISMRKGPSGIPIIREIIIIETEASLNRLLSLLLSVFIYALVFQIFISIWHRLHPKSNFICITTLLFVFPPLFAIYMGDFLFVTLYLAFGVILCRTVFNIIKKPMRSDVPKKTYKLFKLLYRITYVGSLIGQVLLIIGFFSNIAVLMALSLAILFYSLYFGLLTRESIYLISEKMALNLGYYAKDSVPEKVLRSNVCSICDSTFDDKTMLSLSCGHGFHGECIKGWVFMGKRGFCPCCRENVDFGRIEMDLIEKGENLYSKFVDLVRHMVVFIALFVVIGVIRYKK